MSYADAKEIALLRLELRSCRSPTPIRITPPSAFANAEMRRASSAASKRRVLNSSRGPSPWLTSDLISDSP